MSLTSRLFLVTALLIVLAAAAVGGIGRWQGALLADRLALQSLQASDAVQGYFQERRSRELELISELLASDRAFVAYIAQALATPDANGAIDATSIMDLVGERRNQLGFDVAVVLGPDGRVIADSRSPLGAPRDLAELPAVAQALSEVRATRGIWIDGGRAMQIALVPLLLGPTLEGLLLTGMDIDDELARDIGRVSGTQVLFTSGSGAERRLLASSLDLAAAQGLVSALAEHETALAALPASSQPVDLALDVADSRWKTRIQRLGSSEDALQVAAVPPAQRAAIVSDINQLMLWGATAAALVMLLVPVAVSRTVLQPIARLADGADRAGRGDLPQPIEVKGDGDIGRLGRSINRVLADLRELKDMESYLGEVWHQRAAAPLLETNATFDEPDQLLPGQVLGGRYEIRELIDRGGMGVVYRAVDRELGEAVALKTLRSDATANASRIDQLKTEIRTARRITHPNVVRTFDFGQIEGLPFISMEFVRGVTLREAMLRGGRLRLPAGMRIARQLCAGLGAAHRAGVLHRDIKPSNVMLDVTGNAKLMDFGIARTSDPVQDKNGERSFAGTPRYLSPEQCLGREAHETADIYALGVLFCEMFTGQVPIDGVDTFDVCMGHIEREPERPSKLWAEMPPALEALILRCLEKDPAKRYPNTDALRDDLERLRS